MADGRFDAKGQTSRTTNRHDRINGEVLAAPVNSWVYYCGRTSRDRVGPGSKNRVISNEVGQISPL